MKIRSRRSKQLTGEETTQVLLDHMNSNEPVDIELDLLDLEDDLDDDDQYFIIQGTTDAGILDYDTIEQIPIHEWKFK